MRLITFALALAPMAAFAAGGGTSTPPTPSETTTVCEEGMVWDLARETCLPPEESTNEDSARLNDVRELAYEGYLQAALEVLETMENQNDTMTLTTSLPGPTWAKAMSAWARLNWPRPS